MCIIYLYSIRSIQLVFTTELRELNKKEIILKINIV